VSELPDGWAMRQLDSLKAPEPRSITDGPFGSNLTSAHYTASGARVVRLQNIGDGAFIDNPAFISMTHYETLRKHAVQEGDLLIASLGEVLPRACIAPALLGPAIVKADCIRVRLSAEVEPRWVLFALQAPDTRKWAKDQLHGVGRPRLGLKVIRSIPVPVPPIDEQRRIVEILEDHLSRLDAADAYLEAAQRRITGLRLAALSHARRSLIDEGVGLRRLGDIASTALGKMLDAKKATGTPTSYLRNINVRWGAFDISDLNEVQLTDSERARLELRKGDLMVCEGGEPGRCAVWPGGGSLVAYQKALHRLRVLDEAHVDVAFVGLMLEESIRAGRADRMFTGTTIRHLPQEKLRLMEIPVPDPGRQREVVADLGDLESASVHARSECEAARARGRALRRALLHAAFTGRLTGHASDVDCVEELAVGTG
jgi:type I restriction enzyme S subunit